MEEVKSLQINGEEAGDEFYEKIEAPKFVDFTVPDRHHPDDRYWFCLRVGCDQKHEEVLDSEAIYKDFVLRVMAARSPNIKLRKALDRKPPSPSLKYPLTAPAKPSKSRIARLALISSISKKKVEAKDKSRPLLKVSGTPNAKSKQSCVAAKTFTSPRNNRKQIANPDTFRSVRNPRPTDIMVPKNRIVAKALVFHSPKKVVRTKISVDLKTPVKKLCAAMKKLDVADGKKRTLGYNKTLPLDTSRKQVRGREVKSRVFNSLRSNIRKDQEAKPLKCMKRKDREPNLKQRCDPVLHEPGENDLSDMEIDDRSRSDSLEGSFVPGTSKKGDSNDNEECLDVVKTSEPSLSEHPLEDFSQTSRGDTTSLTSCEERDSGDVVKTSEPSLSEHPLEVLLQTSRGDTTSLTSCEERDSGYSDPNACHHEGKIKASPGKRNSPANVDSDDKEYVLASDNTDNDGEDKENASASDYNRGLNDCLEGTISNHDTSKNTKKASQVTKKTLKKNATSAATSALEAKYKKPKPTNPKPFRLRTDERRILKEANLEKKLLTPHKEMKSVKVPGAKPLRKHQNMIQKNENNNGQSEHKNDAHEDCEKRMEKRTHVDQHGKSGTTCLRNLKTSFALDSQKENGRIREERTKSPMVMQKNILRPQRVASCRKARVSSKTPEQLSMIKETSSTVLGPQEAAKPCESSSARQASKATPFRSLSRGRRPTTIPKEPNFHSIHVPKSCTRKMTEVI